MKEKRNKKFILGSFLEMFLFEPGSSVTRIHTIVMQRQIAMTHLKRLCRHYHSKAPHIPLPGKTIKKSPVNKPQCP